MINRAAQSYIPYSRRGCIFFYKKIRFRLLCHALFSVKTNSFHLIIPHFHLLYILFLLLFMLYGLFYTHLIAFTFSFKGKKIKKKDKNLASAVIANARLIFPKDYPPTPLNQLEGDVIIESSFSIAFFLLSITE